MLDRSVDTKRALVAVFGVLLTVAAVFFGEKLSARWLLAWDNGELRCLPYWIFVIDRHDLEVEQGDLVSFRTFGLSAEIRPNAIFTKLVAGQPGDRVRIDDEGVFVNDSMLGPVFEDVSANLGREVVSFHAEYVLGEGEFFLVGTKPSSFDSRFYGPVPASKFIGQTYGVW